jgi:predicted SAM-dependent methyltransferase
VLRVNVGCGQTPTTGWRNFDNSPSVRLAKIPLVPQILVRCGFIDSPQYAFIRFARDHAIEYGDATRALPLAPGSVEVLYSSHMVEHLDHQEALSFLKEAMRVLCSGGTLRLAVPDLKRLVGQYAQSKDADAFMRSTGLTRPRPRTIPQRINAAISGPRNHLWMYDGESLIRLVERSGFVGARCLEAGTTTIVNPDGLDLRERDAESCYVEAKKQ